MNIITNTELTQDGIMMNCIVSSIAHAIGVAKYPMISNEQSWDGISYSVQNSGGQRGTITFYQNIYVASFRNDLSERIRNNKAPMLYFSGASEIVRSTAENETLQYLLEEINGEIVPVITTAFWGDEKMYSNDNFIDIMQNGGELLYKQIFSKENIFDIWIEEYDMTWNEKKLFERIVEEKIKSKNAIIHLKETEYNILAYTEEGLQESKNSFSEIGIIFD